MPEAIICLFRTARACMLPFFLDGAHGDLEAASTAILQMVSAHNFASPVELDLAVRIITFSAAAMDSLRLSMRPDLSDASIRKHRAAAIALDRSAEQCRKVLQAIQKARQPKAGQQSESRPMPVSAPHPSTPLVPSEPASRTSPKHKAEAQSTPAVEDDCDFESDVRTMRRNALAMIANLEAMAQDSRNAEPADASRPSVSPRMAKPFPAGIAATG